MSGMSIPSFSPADLAAVAARWRLDPGLVARLGPAVDRMREVYLRVRDLATEGQPPSRRPSPSPGSPGGPATRTAPGSTPWTNPDLRGADRSPGGR